MKILSKVIDEINYLLFNSYVPGQCLIGKGTKFGKGGIGVVIHQRTIIGKNCLIGQGITIGGRSKKYKVPVIGNNCYLGAGSRVLGSIQIGDNVIIGANAVVLSDIPSNSIAVGIPAKVIKSNIDPKDHI